MSPRLANLCYYLVVGASTIVPLLLHVILGWWAGLLSWFLLVWLYDRLFVAEGAMCMGIAFNFPLSTVTVLVIWDVYDLVMWLLRL